MMKSLKKSPAYGNGTYGKAFDDIETCAGKGLPFPCGIVCRKGVIVDQLTFQYEGFTLPHGGNGGTAQEARLRQGEYITNVSGTYAMFGKDLIIKTLKFTTNKGQNFCVGTPSGNDRSFDFQAETGHAICALHGHADRYLGEIGFYTRKIDMDMTGGMGDFGSKIGSMI